MTGYSTTRLSDTNITYNELDGEVEWLKSLALEKERTKMYAIFVYTIETTHKEDEVNTGEMTKPVKTVKETIDDGWFKRNLEDCLHETEARLSRLPDKGWEIRSHSILTLEDRLVVTFLCACFTPPK